MILDIADVPNMLARIVDLGCTCLADTVTGTPSECRVYHSVPPDDCCDHLVVWLERLYPSKVFPGEWTAGIGNCGEIMPVAAVAVRLRRPCWPVVGDSSPFFPPSADTETAAVNLAMDASQLWCCLFADLTGSPSSILGGANGGMQCAPVTAPTLVPDRNTGGCAGWTIRFSVGLEGCC